MTPKKRNTPPGAETQTVGSGRRNNRLLILFIALFLAAVLIFGIVLGVIAARRDAAYILTFDRTGIDAGTANYLVSYYKSLYIASLQREGVSDAGDDAIFWSRDNGKGKTYGEQFTDDARTFLCQLVAEASLYRSGYSSSDAKKVKNAVAEVLTYRFDGSRAKFNEAAAPYGFDYDDFLAGSILLYKAQQALSYLYGTNGTKIYSEPLVCENFLKGYTHVSLIFVREYTIRDEGASDFRDMTAEERAERTRRIAEIRNAMNGTDGAWISPEQFETFRTKYDESGLSSAAGYYFRDGSQYTTDFGEVFPTVLAKAQEMAIGDYAEVKTDVGTCFLYRLEPEQGAYSDTAEDGCFSDFAALAAQATYAERITALTATVPRTDALLAMDLLAVPYQYEFVARYE